MSFYPCYYKDFTLIFHLGNLTMVYLCVVFLCIFLLWRLPSQIPWVKVFLQFWKIISHYFLNIYFDLISFSFQLSIQTQSFCWYSTALLCLFLHFLSVHLFQFFFFFSVHLSCIRMFFKIFYSVVFQTNSPIFCH